ncbi:MAG: hypothetical protein AB7O97_06225 [Planctomycetota bacterium]
MPHSPGRLSPLLLSLARAAAITGAVALAAWLVACAHQRANPPEPRAAQAASGAEHGAETEDVFTALPSSKSLILLPAPEPVFLPSSKFLEPHLLQQLQPRQGQAPSTDAFLPTSKSGVIRGVTPAPIPPRDTDQ